MTVFKAGGGLNSERYQDIIVRRSEMDRILSHVEDEDLYIALKSPRQTGKTTLLYQVQQQLTSQRYGVAYLDLSDFSGLSEDEFYQTLCGDLLNKLKVLLDNNVEQLPDFQSNINQAGFSNYLKSLSKYTPHIRKLVLILDEVGRVPDESSKIFFPKLRKFYHDGQSDSSDSDLYRKIIFIFAGALDLSKLMQGYNSPLKNICMPFSLKDFSGEQVYRLSANLKNLSSEMIKEISDSVYAWCAGHPYLTQSLLKLIEESQEYSSAKVEQISKIADNLVENNFVYGENANIEHVLNYLRINKGGCQDSVFKILNNQRPKAIAEQQELLLVGLIKRLEDNSLVIRNKIYEKVLQDFFDQQQHQGED